MCRNSMFRAYTAPSADGPPGTNTRIYVHIFDMTVGLPTYLHSRFQSGTICILSLHTYLGRDKRGDVSLCGGLVMYVAYSEHSCHTIPGCR